MMKNNRDSFITLAYVSKGKTHKTFSFSIY